MKNFKSIYAVLGASLLFTLSACGDNGGDDTTTGINPTTTGVDPTTGDNPTTTPDPTTGPEPTTTPDPTTGPEPTTGPDPTTGGEGFVFPDAPFDDYEQIDRHGAVEAGTAGIRASEGLGFNMGSDISIRDDYNASNPEEDAAAMWLPEIADSIMFFHAALDDDLMALKLVPASFDETVAQAGPVILPDTIKYDPTKPTSYPNGRTLTDPVVDITLAAVLIKLGPQQPLTTFADLPLNPPANDVPFKPEFPFLADPHL